MFWKVGSDEYKQVSLKSNWEKNSSSFLKCGVKVQSVQNCKRTGLKITWPTFAVYSKNRWVESVLVFLFWLNQASAYSDTMSYTNLATVGLVPEEKLALR